MRLKPAIPAVLALLWSAQPVMAASYRGTVPGERVGSSVAGLGDTNQDGYDDVLVGAPFSSSGPGSAYLFLGSPMGPTLSWSARLFAPPPSCSAPDDTFGTSVAGIGDFNADGYADFAVAADDYGSCGFPGGTGLVQVFKGSATGPIAGPTFTDLQGTFSTRVFGGGDINGDGYDDMLIYTDNIFRSPEHVVRVRLGSPTGFTGGGVLGGSGGFGSRIAGAGDVNGDGFDDVLVDDPSLEPGGAHLYLGSAAGLVSPSALDLTGQVGRSNGDFNGDGFGDVILRDQTGNVFVHFGSSAGLDAVAGWTISVPYVAGGTLPDFGSAGDLDGDGDDEVLIGVTASGQTRVRIYPGDPGGPATTPFWTLDPPVGAGSFGSHSSAVGDFDGDGLGEVAVGSPTTGTDLGRVDLFGFVDVVCAGQPDADHDGHHAAPCAVRPDCDDADATRYPGAAEVCDGIDQDCDAAVDDDLGRTTCTNGPCSRTVDNCLNGVPQTCVPPTPGPEACDGLDNDCNGLIDDGFGVTTCGVGQCRVTSGNCVGGQVHSCTPGSPGPEVCDGIDNDCDNVVDDVPVPGPVNDLLVDLSQPTPRLVWSALPGITYGSVRGTLRSLNETGGDYSIASEICLEGGPGIEMAEEPPAGDGFWYLTHGRNCAGWGTYDSGSAGQVGSRDPAIVDACP